MIFSWNQRALATPLKLIVTGETKGNSRALVLTDFERHKMRMEGRMEFQIFGHREMTKFCAWVTVARQERSRNAEKSEKPPPPFAR